MPEKNLHITAGEKKSQQPDVDRFPAAPLTGDTQLNKEKLCVLTLAADSQSKVKLKWKINRRSGQIISANQDEAILVSAYFV